MRLTSFQITNYRCIDDSGDVPVDPKVTCLVGKNEAGKTALLEALRRANPLQPAPFNPVHDYPRRRLRAYQREQRRPEATPAHVATAHYELADQELESVEAEFGSGVITGRSLTLRVGYGPKPEVELPVSETAFLKHATAGTGWAEKVTQHTTLKDFLGEAQAASAEDPEAKKLVGRLKPVATQPLSQHIWEKVLQARCPKFMYFDDYSIMTGKAELTALSSPRNEGLRTLTYLLDLAGTTPKELMSDADYERHKAELEATGNDITQEVFEYWRQNTDLEVEFDVHRPQQGGQNAQATFYVRIKNRRHGVTVPFDERSRGFVWFFSFLVAFNKLVDEGVPVIILLDEPGLNLHGKAQADLLRFIEERLAPHHQVLYTTHSPFMVDPEHLERVRTVEEVKEAGTKVGADGLAKDADTVFPLQAALGYDVAQSLFVGPNCLLVEGPSDLLYLQAMSRLCATRGSAALDDRWVITPVGGADKLATFVALMGSNKLNLVVLMDIAKKDRQRINNLVARNLLDSSRVVQVADFTEEADADIEDLLPQGVYVDAVRRTLGEQGKDLDLAHLPKGPRIVKRIEKALGGRRFDHYAVAIKLIPELEKVVDEETIGRFSELFNAVNAFVAASAPPA